MDQIICHCVCEDCSNCPLRNIGTAGTLAEWDFLHKEKDEEDKEE